MPNQLILVPVPPESRAGEPLDLTPAQAILRSRGPGWTPRSPERQISTLYYERLLATSDRPAVKSEARGNLQTPRDFVRDPVMLEFLGLPGTFFFKAE